MALIDSGLLRYARNRSGEYHYNNSGFGNRNGLGSRAPGFMPEKIFGHEGRNYIPIE